MSGVISMLDQGHEHANNAADNYARGLLIPAAEENYKAAEAFQTCADQSTDEHTRVTLRKLCAHHNAVAKDLQRRIAKLTEEGKDPSMPQLSQTSRSTNKSNESGSTLQVPLRGRNLDSSSNTFDESFMVLNQQSEAGAEIRLTGDIMVNLSQPMSFQTAAMAALDAVENRSTSTRSEIDIPRSALDRAGNKLEKSIAKNIVAHEPIQEKESDASGIDEEDYDSLDDFCLVPSTSEASATTVLLKKENAQLKLKLEAMANQMASVHRQILHRNEQDQHLRDNIMLARKEAQRAMAASTSPLVGGRDREGQLLRRIRELEEEARTMRVENEKQKAMIAKFRERWERLKESAKRKKSAKAAGNSDSANVREPIDEDPEAEAAAAAEDVSREST
ncbi:hypothetical protein DFH11DRAFT_1575609 [Phellopilus nigrolimitatus]|nr:hypothetical protein DFH11DRAFT_1575609 [Phellopilus nigrolimitatus]